MTWGSRHLLYKYLARENYIRKLWARNTLVVKWHLRLPAHVYPGEVMVGAVALVLLFKHEGVVLLTKGAEVEDSFRAR